jgi:hypothetical protein
LEDPDAQVVPKVLAIVDQRQYRVEELDGLLGISKDSLSQGGVLDDVDDQAQGQMEVIPREVKDLEHQIHVLFLAGRS